MDTLDKAILDIIQADFPIVARPYNELAGPLECDEAEVISRVAALKDAGVIRKIGPIFDAAKLGYSSALAAAKVPDDQVDAFVARVNGIEGVSHNYARQHEFNVWFTLTMRQEEWIDQTIEQLRKEFGIDDIFALPAIRTYKIRVHFDFGQTKQHQQQLNTSYSKDDVQEFTEYEMGLVRAIQEDMPIVEEPFMQIAEELKVSQDEVIEKILDWKDKKVIRRFGARIRHHKAGFNNNAMVVFQVDPEKVDQTGEMLAGYRQISHCYRRVVVDQWPYNLYAMVHGSSEDGLRELVAELVEKVDAKQYAALKSIKEYKKKSVKYFVE